MTDVDPAFRRVHVPLTWAGVTRTTEDGTRVWTCGACPDQDACYDAGVCQRATPEDFQRGVLG